jgi:hypothetical protein
MTQRQNFDDWADEFDPIDNHFDPDASYDGKMFETYGEQFEFVKEHADQLKVWTIIEGDDDVWLTNGLHRVNRIGHLISALPYLGDDLEIPL